MNLYFTTDYFQMGLFSTKEGCCEGVVVTSSGAHTNYKNCAQKHS